MGFTHSTRGRDEALKILEGITSAMETARDVRCVDLVTFTQHESPNVHGEHVIELTIIYTVNEENSR